MSTHLQPFHNKGSTFSSCKFFDILSFGPVWVCPLTSPRQSGTKQPELTILNGVPYLLLAEEISHFARY